VACGTQVRGSMHQRVSSASSSAARREVFPSSSPSPAPPRISFFTPFRARKRRKKKERERERYKKKKRTIELSSNQSNQSSQRSEEIYLLRVIARTERERENGERHRPSARRAEFVRPRAPFFFLLYGVLYLLFVYFCDIKF